MRFDLLRTYKAVKAVVFQSQHKIFVKETIKEIWRVRNPPSKLTSSLFYVNHVFSSITTMYRNSNFVFTLPMNTVKLQTGACLVEWYPQGFSDC